MSFLYHFFSNVLNIRLFSCRTQRSITGMERFLDVMKKTSPISKWSGDVTKVDI